MEKKSMIRVMKRVGLALLIVLVIGQFFRPKQNISSEISPNDISHTYPIPNEIYGIFKKACLDCHSNNTVYPSYNKIFPVSWYLYNHIYGGKKHFDFSEFASYSPKKQRHKLEEIIEVIEEGRMPMKSYVRLHPEASLSAAEKALIKAWVYKLRAKIKE